MKFKTKICLKCGQEYQPTGSRQKRCSGCVAQYETEHKAAWQLAHPEYYMEHRETILAKAAAQRADHPEETRIARLAYAAAHPGANARWVALHPEQWASIRGKHQAKYRLLGFVPLNKPFLGCEGHHVDNE